MADRDMPVLEDTAVLAPGLFFVLDVTQTVALGVAAAALAIERRRDVLPAIEG